MAVGLTPITGPVPARLGRRLAWTTLVLVVLAVHACVTQGVASRLADLDNNLAPPARMEVAYVREMTLSEPPVTAAPAAPPEPAAAARRRPVKAAKPSPKASGPASGPASAPDAALGVAPDAVLGAAPDDVSGRPSQAPEPIAAAASAPASMPDPTPAQEVEKVADAASAPELVSATHAGAAGPTQPVFEWPASTRMNYSLTGNYRGEVSGSAQVEWVRVGSHYQVHVDFIVGPKFAPLITHRSTSDGEITSAGLAPRRYDQDTTFLASARPRQTIIFDAGNVVLSNGDVRPAPQGMQDTASQFVQLTYVFSTRPEMLRIGGSVDIPLALPRKAAIWTYDVAAQETLATPFGPLTGIHLKPRASDQRAGTLSVEMWMAPQLRYLPVRIRFEQDPQTYVDLLISKPPEIAN